MSTHCAYCGKKGQRAYETHTNYRIKLTGKKVVANPHMSLHLQRMEDEQVKVDTPYRGNLKVVRETDYELTLWDGESYKLTYGNFCKMKCAWAYAEAAVRKERRVS